MLHSIGEIQITLKQYADAEQLLLEAVEVRNELAQLGRTGSGIAARAVVESHCAW